MSGKNDNSTRNNDSISLTDAFLDFVTVIKTLRGPNGCPWDKEQTPSSIKENLVEETYECIEAIVEDDTNHIREELGDIFLLATMISYMYEQNNVFTIEDVLREISEKLKRRHPHVFGDVSVYDSEEVIRNWDAIKKNVEKQGDGKKYLDTIPKNFPPLQRALKIQKKVKKVGFDWNSIDDVWEKLDEEIEELKEISNSENKNGITEELGDVLFTIVNIARFLGVDPSTALHVTNEKFKDRFHYIEREMKKSNSTMSAETFSRMDAYWEESKKRK